MADTSGPPKAGLDLSKLLGSAKNVVDPVAAASPVTDAHAAESVVQTPEVAKPSSGGLDLSKLMLKTKPAPLAEAPAAKEPVAPAREKASEPVAEHRVQLTGKLTFSDPPKTEPPKAPSKPVGVGGQRAVGQVGQAGGVAAGAKAGQMVGAFSAPAAAQAEPAKALAAAAPSNRKLEAQMSRGGLEIDRLNIVQKEARKYPAGYFGVDEIFLAIQDTVNVMRANLWRALPEYSAFVIGAKIMGAVRRDAFCVWDGENFTGPFEVPPAEPTAYSVLDADDVIDNCRGKLSCTLFQSGPRHEMHGDVHLGRVLRLISVAPEPEQMEDMREREEQRLAERMAIRKRCTTPVEWVQKLIELRIETAAKFIEDPIFFRVTVESEPKQEILFHIEKTKLTTLIGKPGETLLPGALEITLSVMGMQGLWDTELDWPFLFSSGLARASGDLDLLSRLYWVNFEIVRRIRLFNQTQKAPSPENPYALEVRKVAPAKGNK